MSLLLYFNFFNSHLFQIEHVVVVVSIFRYTVFAGIIRLPQLHFPRPLKGLLVTRTSVLRQWPGV